MELIIVAQRIPLNMRTTVIKKAIFTALNRSLLKIQKNEE